MLQTRSLVALTGLAMLAMVTAPGALAPAHADGVRTFNCVGGRGAVSCVSTWRRGYASPYIIPVPAVRSDLDVAEAQQREKAWDARCKPSVRHDEYGVPRYVYGASGCEFGRSQ
jgi:hypothetical protein